MHYWTGVWSKQHKLPVKTAEGRRIKLHIPLQTGPGLPRGSVYLPPTDPPPQLSVVSQSKLNKHVLGWSREHLCAGPAFVLP